MNRFAMKEKDKLIKLSSQVIDLAIKARRMIVTVESCTGGLVAKSLTDIPGSSSGFSHGIVAYSNSAKMTILNIKKTALKEHGAVSEQIAIMMAKNALNENLSHVSVAITGIAGPTGASNNKPIGTVWLAWSYYKENQIVIDTQLCYFDGDRNKVRLESTMIALTGLEKRLKKLHSV